MSLGSFLASPFSPSYNIAQGLPGYMQGSNQQGLQQAQAETQTGVLQQQNFLNALGGTGLNGSQRNIMGQQQALANQYGQIAQGKGPNPAQTQLAQNTGQNIQQQAALMAGARGAQSNPGLIARQAGQVGANAQQQAVGQAATLGAQQQLAGMQGMAAQQGQMSNLATAGVGQQQTALSQLGNQNLAYQQMLQNALTTQNQQQVQAQTGQGQLAAQAMQNTAGLEGGILSGIGGMMSGGGGGGGGGGGLLSSIFAKGGVVGYDDGGTVGLGANTDLGFGGGSSLFSQAQSGPSLGVDTNIQTPAFTAAQDKLGQQINAPQQSSNAGDASTPTFGANTGAQALFQGFSDLGKGIGEGIKSMSMMAASQGGAVGGKPKVFGDSEVNDTVPAKLSPGEIVIKRTASGSPEKAAAFLNKLMGWNLRAA